MVGEMTARVHVEVLGRHGMPVVAMAARQVFADRPGDGGTAGYGQRAALAEVVLYINDDERTHGANGILRMREACAPPPPGCFRARAPRRRHRSAPPPWNRL